MRSMFADKKNLDTGFAQDSEGKIMRLIRGDARTAPLSDNSVDAIICDPPYGLNFMGENWDHGVPGVLFWTEALRVLKPGGHLHRQGKEQRNAVGRDKGDR